MIDPEKVTNYDLDRAGLEENAVFWVLVAGKTADVVAVALERILDELSAATKLPRAMGAFFLVQTFRGMRKQLRPLLKRHGIGCHGSKARSLHELVDSDLDLATCTLADLIAIHGIGLKTAQCFLLHTRRDSNVVGLDTHMLAELRERGFDAPKATPSSLKTYEKWSEVVRGLAQEAGMTMPEFDLHIFNKRHRKVFRAGDGGDIQAPPAKAKAKAKVKPKAKVKAKAA